MSEPENNQSMVEGVYSFFEGYDFSSPSGFEQYLQHRRDGVFSDGYQMRDFTPPYVGTEQYFASGEGTFSIAVRPLPGAISSPPGILYVYHPDSEWNNVVSAYPIGGQGAVRYTITYGGETPTEYWGNISYTTVIPGVGIPGVPKWISTPIHLMNRGELALGTGYTIDASVDGKCFAAGTLIDIPGGQIPIEKISIGDLVLSYDPKAEGGLGGLMAQRVVRLFRNDTKEWYRLTWMEKGVDQTMIVTPEHHILCPDGLFRPLRFLASGRLIDLVLKNGEIASATAEIIRFNERNCNDFEVSTNDSSWGNLALKNDSESWKTYNFEVEKTHTYIANGVRVHNDSISDLLGGISTTYNNVWVQTTNTLGGVASYINEQGQTVTTSQGSNYSEAMLQHYGVETEHTDANGNVTSTTARMTLGGHFRALADWLGFDGDPGIQGDYARDNEGSGEPASDAAKPVIIDLDGDGVEINADAQVSFDWDNDGFRESGNWAAADDGFLVVDLEADGTIGTNGGDGIIDQGREIAFSQWSDTEMTDLQALAEATDADGNLIFDSNGDGVLDANDNIWNSMKIFQDLNQNGEVDEGELQTLGAWGITQINLSYGDGSSFSEYDDDVVALGNILHGLASYVRDGETIEGGVGDVSLFYNTQGWRRVETDSGYTIEFEGGDDAMAFWNVENLASANVDLTANNLAGAYGDDRNNVLDGSGSTDQLVITGGGGNDTITGGEGDDLLTGGAGADIIHGGAGHDVILADSSDDISGGAIAGGEGYDKLIVSEETTLSIGDLSAIGFEEVLAGGGNDTITALDYTSYSLSGNGGDDTLTTAGGYDILSGGAGDDTLSSGAGSDRLFGGEGNDTLDAGDDDDFLSGGAGDDTLHGGGGNDRYFYARGYGHDIIRDFATGTIMERMEYQEQVQHGSGKGASYTNEMRTGFVETTGQIDGGIDTLEFGYGINVSDVLFSRVGDDAFIQLRNQDDSDTETIDESDSIDTDGSITITDWTDQRSRIENFAFADGTVLDMSQIMHGQTGHGEVNTMTGTDEGDWLNAGGGNDTLNGNAGNDVLIAGGGNDTLDGGEGRDFLFAGDGDDIASGGEGDDYILGGEGNDTLNGGAGNDALSGDAGDDTINGGAGNDIIVGGAGNDTLNGGAGDDTYIYFRGDGQDTIHDYSEEEQDVEEETGNTVYQRSGKSGHYVQEMRTVQRMVQTDGGWDIVQFGYSVAIADVFFNLDGTDLVMGIRQFDEDGNALTLDQYDDVVTVADWTNENSRIEELRFGDGYAIDISEFGGFQSGYGSDDTLTGTDLGDLLSGGAGNDTLDGGAGNDVLVGGDGDDDIAGGAGEDDILGGDGDDTLRGGAGKDYILGGTGNDTIEGGAGDDVLTGGRGDDILRGGLGNDIYIFNRGDGHDTIDESIFNVTISGTTETVAGSAEDFSVGSMAGKTGDYDVWVNETRTGAVVAPIEGGNDILQFGNYIDVTDLIVNTDGDGIGASLVVELDPVVEGADVQDSVTISNWGTPEFRVETFRFSNGFSIDVSDIGYANTGGAENDVIETAMTEFGATTYVAGAAWLSGGAGDDTITGSGTYDYNDILIGGAGDDRLEGGLGDDTYVFGRGDGHDTILDGGSSAVGTDAANPGGDKLLFNVGITIEDLILQRDGNTMNIYVANQNDMTVPLTELTDVVSVENWNVAGNRIELLQFFNGLDFDVSDITNTYLGTDLTGSGSETPVNDTLNGSASADWIDGFAGDDVLNGNGGDDFIFGRAGEDTLNGNAGDDIMTGGAGNDTVNGGAGGDVMTGGGDDDILNGDGGNDVVMGGTGNDTLNGGAGNDLIVGDHGDDILIASAGQDQYRFGYGDGNDTYQGNIAYAGTDTFIFEDDISAEDVWFERIDNSLIVRLHGADDTITFEGWFQSTNPSAYINGFVADGEFLSYTEVNSLVTSMSSYVADLNDGTTAYGLLPGETPDTVLTAIDTAWA